MTYEDLVRAWRTGRRAATASVGDWRSSTLESPPDRNRRIGLYRRDELVTVLQGPWDRTIGMDFSAGAAYFAAAGDPCGVAVWHVATGRLLAELRAQPWRTTKGRGCLPVHFTLNDQFLVVGGRGVFVVETSGWSRIPVADFPVLAILPDLTPQSVLLVGPEEEGEFPVESFALDSFSLSARLPIHREHPSTTILPGPAGR